MLIMIVTVTGYGIAVADTAAANNIAAKCREDRVQ